MGRYLKIFFDDQVIEAIGVALRKETQNDKKHGGNMAAYIRRATIIRLAKGGYL